MKKVFLLASLLVQVFILNAQTLEPQIKFNLVFEDARQHFDTVTVGYDSLGWVALDPEFGEVNLVGQSFDSIFEVRGADISGYQYQSNPTVAGFRQHMCEPSYHWPEYQSIIIRAKNWPVTITWDQGYFSDDCYDWTHFTRIWSYLFNPNFINGDISKLADYNSLTVSKDYIRQTNGYKNNRLEPIVGGGQDSVYVIWVGLSANMPTNAVEGHTKTTYNAYPNPTSTNLYVELNDWVEPAQITAVQASDLSGNKIPLTSWAILNNRLEFDCSHLKSGFYVGHCFFRDGRRISFKFVKQ